MQNRTRTGITRPFGLGTSAFRHVSKVLFGFAILAMMGAGSPQSSEASSAAPKPTPTDTTTTTPSPTTPTAAVIRGTVTIDGVAAAGVRVSLLAGPSGGNATTDTSGNYEFDSGMSDGT